MPLKCCHCHDSCSLVGRYYCPFLFFLLCFRGSNESFPHCYYLSEAFNNKRRYPSPRSLIHTIGRARGCGCWWWVDGKPELSFVVTFPPSDEQDPESGRMNENDILKRQVSLVACLLVLKSKRGNWTVGRKEIKSSQVELRGGGDVTMKEESKERNEYFVSSTGIEPMMNELLYPQCMWVSSSR